MVVRPIKPEELPRAQEIDNIAFGFEPDPQKPPEAPGPDAHLNHRAVFDEAGNMGAVFQIVPFRVRFDGGVFDMGGIGGVASLPEIRNRGYIRALFEAGLREMYGRGMAFSMLFPFSHPFYRKFGYELTHFRQELVVPMESFVGHRIPGGTFTQIKAGDDETPLRELYESFAKPLNLSVVRGDAEWERVRKGDLRQRPAYTYLWRDDGGAPGAYFACRKTEYDGQPALQIASYAWAGPEGLMAIFGLLRSMGAQYFHLLWSLPDWMEVLSMFPEPYRLKATLATGGMTRVVNVKQVLEGLRHPEGSGSYTLSVEDPFLPENHGLWQVRWQEGQATAEKADTGAPDLSLDIQGLTQLAVGTVDLDGLLLGHPGNRLHASGDALRRVFTKRHVYLADYF